jgi:ATP-dependent Zn protease
MRKVPIAPDVDAMILARGCPGSLVPISPIW